MYLLENISLAVAGLKANKMRALLTMLGIIIGIGSVIAIVTVGNSMTASVSSSMQSLGATNVIVSIQERSDNEGFGPGGGGGDMSSMFSEGLKITEADLITDDMLETYTALYGDDIQAISLSHSVGSGKAQDGNLYANVTVMGVNSGYAEANNVEMVKGRALRESDVKSSRYSAVVSDKLAGKMFPGGQDPLGQEVKININNQIQTYTVVGVYKYVESGFAFSSAPEKDLRTNMYIPITTSQLITSADKGYQTVTVMAAGSTDTVRFAKTTKDFFNKYYANNTRFQVSTISMESAMSQMTSMLGTISVAIAVIAAISLLVGGIGVMNIMLVSVTERTREIGTRKALGARSAYILTQFIVEAVIICAIGGIIGIFTGMALGYAGSLLLGFPSAPSIPIIFIAVLFSMFIGVFFGYYPANKAAKLDPIEALRYE